MSGKYNQTNMVKEFKQDLANKLVAIAAKLEHQDEMKIAIALEISLSSVTRYLSGNLKELRRLELAESILSTAKEVLRSKEAAPVTV